MRIFCVVLLSLCISIGGYAQLIPRPLVGPVTISTTQAAATPLSISAAAGTTANLQEWNVGGGTIEAYIDSTGRYHGGIAATGGTPGQFLYTSATGSLASSPATFYDSVNNRIGLFTASPASSLHINGVTTFSARVVMQDQGLSTSLLQGQTLVGPFDNVGYPLASYGLFSVLGYATIASIDTAKKNTLYLVSDPTISKERIGTGRADATVSYWPLVFETAGAEVLNLTVDPFVQWTTSYAGANVSAAGTVALRNNAGALQASQNAGAWSTILTGATGVTSITGTANQVIRSSPTGAVTLSTPQDIGTASNVTFGSLTVTDVAYGGGWNGSSLVPTRNAVYDEIESVKTTVATKAAASAVGAHTIILLKLTGGGTNGSITWSAEGVITAYVDPT